MLSYVWSQRVSFLWALRCYLIVIIYFIDLSVYKKNIFLIAFCLLRKNYWSFNFWFLLLGNALRNSESYILLQIVYGKFKRAGAESIFLSKKKNHKIFNEFWSNLKNWSGWRFSAYYFHVHYQFIHKKSIHNMIIVKYR